MDSLRCCSPAGFAAAAVGAISTGARGASGVAVTAAAAIGLVTGASLVACTSVE